MNIEDKKALISLIVSNLKYRNIDKNNFEVTGAVNIEKINQQQMSLLQDIGISSVVNNKTKDKKPELLLFGLSNLLIADQNTPEGLAAQTKIVEDYKNKHVAVKYSQFINLGATLGTLGLAATTALMIATSPITSIVLGGATISLALYDNTKHIKKILAQQLEYVLDKKLQIPMEKISILREHYNNSSNQSTSQLKVK